MGARAGALTISVVVPARDAETTIGRTLAALRAQSTEHPYEVIVVEGGSVDATAALARAAGVQVLHNPGGEPAASRNLGARRASAELLAFTDADCEPSPEWLSAGIAALRAADLVQGLVLPAGAVGLYDRTVDVGSEYGLYETANLFVRRDWFDRVGGFVRLPGLRLGDGQHFGEDAWFAWRVKRAGGRSSFTAGAVVRHAVFMRGAGDWVREHLRRRYFPQLVALIPELRGVLLHRRWFLSPVSLRFDLMLLALGTAAAAPSRRARAAVLALGVPYALDLAHDRRAGARFIAARLAADALTCAALVYSSIGVRTLVL